MARSPARLAAFAGLLAHAHAACRTKDKFALQKLFKDLDGYSWGRWDHWDPEGGTDPCNYDTHWYGVGCIDPCDIYRDGTACTAGRITALTLHDNNMTGSLSNWSQVGELHNLTWVDFSYNGISGTIPRQFGAINNIEMLNLAHNSLAGFVPTQLGELNSNGFAELTELNLAHNSLSGVSAQQRRQPPHSLLSPSPRLPVSHRTLPSQRHLSATAAPAPA